MSTTQVRVSWDEFLARCPESRLVEWVGGEVVAHTPPLTRHQLVTQFLQVLLLHFAEITRAGVVLPAPYLMRLSPDGPAREPDVLFVAETHRDRIRRERVEGPADLAVEVISEDSVARDRSEKFYEYQRFGVREYWLIDPRPGLERADFWVLDGEGRYRAALPDAEGVYRATVLPGFWLRPEWLRADPLPPTLAALGWIAGDEAARALRTREEP